MTTAAPTPEDVFGAATIPAALEAAAGGDRGITLIDRNLTESPLPYRELADAAARAAAGLELAGAGPGDRVCLMSPTSADLLATLFGAWRAGCVPVVLPLPRRLNDLDTYLDDVAARVEAADARLLVVADLFADQGVSLDRVSTPAVRPADLLEAAPIRRPAGSSPDDLAFLQFTSGTTAQSRAVALSHSQILGNIVAAGALIDVHRDRDVFVSWLPLFHDMGLIGLLIGAVAFGLPLVLEPTEEFLARPGSWLDAMSRYSGTLTASPNFGYGLAARDLAARPRSLDLSACRIVANGAEAVDGETMTMFAAAAGKYGLHPEAMCGMYGLAEATLCVTLSRGDTPVRIDYVDRDVLEAERRAVPVDPSDEHAKALVGCGFPIPGTDVSILDDDGNVLSDGQVGHISVRGPGVMTGYWRDPERTAETIRDGWLRTGDLGFWGTGGLVICGREKDMIILGGRNLYPEDYEFWTEKVPGVRRGNVIAFALPEAERMVVVAETTASREDAAGVARDALLTLRKRLPRGPEEVVLIQAGTLPKTSSGKRQRGTCRDQYVSGELEAVAVAKR